MQDNPQPDFGDAFEDKAWLEMRKQLDKEMPVQGNERRFLLWWWLGGLAMIGFSLLIGWTTMKKNSPRRVKESLAMAKEEVKKLEALESSENKIIDASFSSALSESMADNAAAPSINKETPNNDQTKVTSTNTSINHALNNTYEIASPAKFIKPQGYSKQQHSKKEAIPDKNKRVAEILSSEFVPAPTLTTNGYEKEQSILFTTIRPTLEEITHQKVSGDPLPSLETQFASALASRDKAFEPLRFLPSTTSTLLSITPLESIPFLIPNRVLVQKNITWHWGITATIGTFKLTKPNDYSVGLVADYQWHSKWRLQTGINYQMLRLNFLLKDRKSNDSFDVTALGSVNKDMNTSNIPNSPTVGTVPPITQDPKEPVVFPVAEENFANSEIDKLLAIGKVHYLSTPLRLEYKYADKLSLNASTTLYYAINDSYDTINSQSTRLRKWDMTSAIGITYYVHPKLGLLLNYELGWFEKRKALSRESNNLPSLDKVYSPLEGRIRVSGVWLF